MCVCVEWVEDVCVYVCVCVEWVDDVCVCVCVCVICQTTNVAIPKAIPWQQQSTRPHQINLDFPT